MTKVSNCGHDENWKYSGGAAGDQTGNEWYVRDWYYFSQNVVLRHPDPKVRALISQLGTEAAENDMVGYDQGQRETFWQQLSKVGYYPSKIAVKCEADCSSGVAAIVKAVGYILNDAKLKAVPTSMYTGNERSILVNAGFQALTASKYLTTGGNLIPGDINLNERTHTNIVVGDTPSSSAAASDGKLAVDGYLGPKSVAEWQRQCGTTVDGVVSGQSWSCTTSYPNLTSVTYEGNGSQLMKKVQETVGVPNPTGVIAGGTVCMLQGWLVMRGYSCAADNAGVLGPATAKAVQQSLNDGVWN